MIILILVCIVLCAVIVVSPYLKQRKSYFKFSQNIRNHDSFMREFCYRANIKEDEFWSALDRVNAYSVLKYRLIKEEKLIVFYSDIPDGFPDVTYKIQLWEMENYLLLKLKQVNLFQAGSKYIYQQNEFWKQKVEAEPIWYFEDF